MASDRRTVLRKCAGCLAMKDRREMIRVIRLPQGEVLIDDTQKKSGRGAYVCRSASCVETAMKKRGIERALKCGVDRRIYELLKEKTEATL